MILHEYAVHKVSIYDNSKAAKISTQTVSITVNQEIFELKNFRVKKKS